MVDRIEGQFYTMEGIAAAVLMVLTAYLVLSGTTMYTPGDTHIIDMQLEQVGSDALKVMDTKNIDSTNETFSYLESYVRNMTTTGKNDFKTEFKRIIDISSAYPDNIHFKADIYYRLTNDTIKKFDFTESDRKFSGNENAVRVSRWVFVDKAATNVPSADGFRDNNQTVLLEVLLWRG